MIEGLVAESNSAGLTVDGHRLWGRLMELAAIGAVHGPSGERGNSRLALTDADRDGRDLVVAWMQDLGLSVAIDSIGNVVATRAGTDSDAAAVMTGSHIDTVATGGRFDGNLGVLAGLEVIETLIDHGVTTRRPIQVGFFTDEEGARFAPDMLGSLVYVGGLALEEALDAKASDDGVRLGIELERIGYSGSTPCPTARAPHAFVELHIEQGPVLEDQGVTIGVVTGVQGISWTELTITGRSAHAGTTPIRSRRDPGVVAAAIVVEARRLANEMGGSQVATVGRVVMSPNLINVVPQHVTLTLDLRNTEEAALRRAEDHMAGFVERVCEAEGCQLQSRSLARFEPVLFDGEMIERIERIAQAQGQTTVRMPSGAGHDAQMIARLCPAGMIFVPSVDGLSHNIAEFTKPADIAAGADVLLQTMVELAQS